MGFGPNLARVSDQSSCMLAGRGSANVACAAAGPIFKSAKLSKVDFVNREKPKV